MKPTALNDLSAFDPVTSDRVQVVSHSQEVQELCDERIEVGRG